MNYQTILLLLILLAQFSFGLSQPAPDSVYKHLENMPVFNVLDCSGIKDKKNREACGERMFVSYLNENKNYPDEAFKNKISGKVTAQFVINTSGKIEQIKILRGLGYGCDEDLIRILTELNQRSSPWVPGRIKKKPVNVLKTVTVKYEPEIFGNCVSGNTALIKEIGLDDVYPIEELDIFPVHPECIKTNSDDFLSVKCSKIKLHEDMYKNLRSPMEFFKTGVGGSVSIQFIINTEGNIDYPAVIQFDKAYLIKPALDVIEKIKMGGDPWKAGFKDGKAVNTLIEFTFNFSNVLHINER
jgi:TonB family protein